MAKMKAKTKKLFKVVGTIVAVAFTLGIVSTLASRCDAEESKTLGMFDYEIGALSDTTGKKLKDDKTGLVAKDMYAIDGFTVEMVKDADVKYQLNFYDEDKVWVSATTYKRDFDGEEIEALKAQGIAYVRPEIVPLDDEEVTVWEVRGYAKQLTVTVSTEKAEEKDEDSEKVEETPAAVTEE